MDQPAHAKEQNIVGTTSTVIRVPIIDHSKDPDYSKTNWSLEDAKVDMEIMKQNGIADAIRVPQSYYVRFLFWNLYLKLCNTFERIWLNTFLKLLEIVFQIGNVKFDIDSSTRTSTTRKRRRSRQLAAAVVWADV